MVKFFISSHGRLAGGFVSAAEFLLGSAGALSAFDAYLDERSVEDALDAFYADVREGDTAVLLADVTGGSVANAMARYAVRDDTFLVGGVNLATVLELLTYDSLTKEDIEEAVELGRQNLRLIEFDANTAAKDDSGEFF